MGGGWGGGFFGGACGVSWLQDKIVLLGCAWYLVVIISMARRKIGWITFMRDES